MASRRKKVQRFEDTAANWAADNPILPANWEGIESDTGQWKQGDGVTAWNSLSYAAGGAGASTLNDLTDVVIAGAAEREYLRHNGTNWVNAAIDRDDLPTSIDPTKLGDGIISKAEFQQLNGASSNIQTQLDGHDSLLTGLSSLVSALDAAVVLKGTWDASAGTFPGAGAAQAGWSYIVSVGGTVDGVAFVAGDRIIAIADNASTGTYAANWFISDYTDKVSSVNGLVGAVSLLVSELTGSSAVPSTIALGGLKTTSDGRFFHGKGTNDVDEILKASRIGGTRAVTGTSDTILVADFSKIVTFTNAAAIAVTLPQAGAGSPAEFVDKWYATFVNIGPSKVTITPTTSTIGGAATLQLGPGQAAMVWSNGTNYLCIAVDSMKIGIACSDETTAITTGTAKATFRMPCAMKLLAVRASVTTAPTGSTILIDINEGGATVLSTKLMIGASEKTSVTAATPAVISDAVLADDAEITIDFDQVGSTIAGAGVKVWLIGIPG